MRCFTSTDFKKDGKKPELRDCFDDYVNKRSARQEVNSSNHERVKFTGLDSDRFRYLGNIIFGYSVEFRSHRAREREAGY